MNHLPKAQLADLILEAQSGFASGKRDEEGIAQIRMNNVTTDGQLDFSSIRRVPVDATKNVQRFFLNEGDILFNSTNSPQLVGKTALFKMQDEPFVFSNHFVRIAVNPKRLDSSYLARWLTQQQQKGYFASICTQWVNQASVRKEDLLSLEIPLPPLAEQKRIARILDVAAAVQAQRRATLTHLDTLLQSTFLHMFGDPVTNPMRWPVKPVIESCDCIVPGRDKPKSFTGNIAWITTEDLVPLGITLRSKKELGLTLSEIREVRARIIPKNSVVMTCVGDLGITSVAGQDFVMNQQLHSFQCSDKLNSHFLAFSLSFQKPYMYKMATSTVVPYMNKSVCNSVPTIMPPIELQERFAERVEKIEQYKSFLVRDLDCIESLFQSLQQRAFRGELSPSP